MANISESIEPYTHFIHETSNILTVKMNEAELKMQKFKLLMKFVLNEKLKKKNFFFYFHFYSRLSTDTCIDALIINVLEKKKIYL